MRIKSLIRNLVKCSSGPVLYADDDVHGGQVQGYLPESERTGVISKAQRRNYVHIIVT